MKKSDIVVLICFDYEMEVAFNLEKYTQPILHNIKKEHPAKKFTGCPAFTYYVMLFADLKLREPVFHHQKLLYFSTSAQSFQ